MSPHSILNDYFWKFYNDFTPSEYQKSPCIYKYNWFSRQTFDLIPKLELAAACRVAHQRTFEHGVVAHHDLLVNFGKQIVTTCRPRRVIFQSYFLFSLFFQSRIFSSPCSYLLLELERSDLPSTTATLPSRRRGPRGSLPTCDHGPQM